jgi:hypothetical protein
MPVARINLPAVARRSKARRGCWIFESSCFDAERLSEKDEATRLGLKVYYQTYQQLRQKQCKPFLYSMMNVLGISRFFSRENNGLSWSKTRTRNTLSWKLNAENSKAIMSAWFVLRI